ncbi:ATP-binding protein [Streptomyces cellostaticus]|uniref:ATP-binding protein n=1 Tax=Streptomyces cellostaticus TaxID=67285 RepID=UPI00202734F6|nr:ATP-binding protein [Streptomyces cellostaticus]
MNQQISTRIPNFGVRLSPTPRGARLARLLASEQLGSWGAPLDPAVLIVAELAANAATHGRVTGRDFRLTLYVVADVLRIEVTDTRGDRLPHVGDGDPESTSGRGLLLVDALADRWGVTPGPAPRKTVWAEVTLPPRPGNPCSGPSGALCPRTTGGKEPDQAPPLPPTTAHAHSPG